MRQSTFRKAGPALLTIALPLVSAAQSWDRPVEGYRQIGCYAAEPTARRQTAALQEQGLKGKVIYKPEPGCYALLVEDIQLPLLTYQIGAFERRENARLVADSVRSCGFETGISEFQVPGGTLFRVRAQVSADARRTEAFQSCLRSNPFVPDEAELVTEH